MHSASSSFQLIPQTKNRRNQRYASKNVEAKEDDGERSDYKK
jgi:hypothetical protein